MYVRFLKCSVFNECKLGIFFLPVEQAIKSQVNVCSVEMKIENMKRKKVFIFNDVRLREKFCQLVQTMKNLHREDDQIDVVSVFVGSWNMGEWRGGTIGVFTCIW